MGQPRLRRRTTFSKSNINELRPGEVKEIPMTTHVSHSESPKPEYSKKTNLINATGDNTQSLQDFVLPDLQQFTREGVYSNTARTFICFMSGATTCTRF